MPLCFASDRALDMIPNVTLRPEEPQDYQTIHDLTRDAFAPMPFADGTEAGSIDAMRKAGDLTMSFVAVTDHIVGHVAFSAAQISGAEGLWFALGPISIEAGFQRKGIGTMMAKAGLAELAKMGAEGCVLLGNPAVYNPMGFVSDGRLTFGSLNTDYIMYHSLTGAIPTGEITFVDALQADYRP